MAHDLALAQNHAFQLARTLMVPVILFKVSGEYGVLVAEDLEDADVEIIHEFDPHDCRPAH